MNYTLSHRQLDQNAGLAAAEVPRVLDNLISVVSTITTANGWDTYGYRHRGHFSVDKSLEDTVMVIKLPWSRVGTGSLTNVKEILADLKGAAAKFYLIQNEKILKQFGDEFLDNLNNTLTLDQIKNWLLNDITLSLLLGGGRIVNYKLIDGLLYYNFLDNITWYSTQNTLHNINKLLSEFYNNNIPYYYKYLLKNSRIIENHLNQYFNPDLSREILEYGVLETFTEPKTLGGEPITEV